MFRDLELRVQVGAFEQALAADRRAYHRDIVDDAPRFDAQREPHAAVRVELGLDRCIGVKPGVEQLAHRATRRISREGFPEVHAGDGARSPPTLPDVNHIEARDGSALERRRSWVGRAKLRHWRDDGFALGPRRPGRGERHAEPDEPEGERAVLASRHVVVLPEDARNFAVSRAPRRLGRTRTKWADVPERTDPQAMVEGKLPAIGASGRHRATLAVALIRALFASKRNLHRTLLALGGAAFASSLGAWMLVNHTSWAGPLFANGLRRVIGAERVTHLEEFSYGLQDRWNRFRHRNEAPKARWAAPPEEVAEAVVADAGTGTLAGAQAFRPTPVGPFSKKWFAPGDGEWVKIPDPRHPELPALLYKTLIHPDIHRSWADLFVVAVSLDEATLHARAGTGEPKSDPGAPELRRTGRIPEEDLPSLVGAFNGGFMAEHGHYGMRVSGVTLVKPRPKSCTVVGYSNGTVEIATWDTLAADADERIEWFRQTPACMYENNTMHLGLRYPETRLWGATLDGDTVIRRSAIGLDESRRILFVGISNNTTARALAEGMHHAGAADVAQLDVNWSYPKFLLYAQNDKGDLVAQAPVDGFEYNPGEYVSKSAYRDFFYLTRKAPLVATTADAPKAN